MAHGKLRPFGGFQGPSKSAKQSARLGLGASKPICDPRTSFGCPMWGPSRGRRIIADGLTAPKGIQREGSGRVGIMLRRKRPSSPRGMGVGAVIRKRAASPGKQKGYPAVKWEDFVPQDILHLWKELTAWQPDVVGQYVPVEKEQLLRPPPLFLHSTPDLPCRPIERQEALADVELLFAMRFVLQDCSFHTIVSITGNIFIPIIARHFDVSADEELALDEPWAAKQLQDRYEGLTRQVRFNINASLQKAKPRRHK